MAELGRIHAREADEADQLDGKADRLQAYAAELQLRKKLGYSLAFVVATTDGVAKRYLTSQSFMIGSLAGGLSNWDANDTLSAAG